MPVTKHKPLQEALYQREQYAKGGLGRLYWDFRDRTALSLIRETDRVLLDLGCGEGITLEKMVRLFPGRQVFGMDVIEENLKISRKYGLDVRYGDALGLPLPENSVDFVLFSEVIEHLSRPEEALVEIRRVLRPGGRLVIIFPNDLVFKIARLVTLRFREAAFDPGHLKQWTPKEMSLTLQKCGFEVCFWKAIPVNFWPSCLHAVFTAGKRFVP